MHQMLSHSSYPHANLNGEIKAPAPVLYFSNALIGINKGTQVEELQIQVSLTQRLQRQLIVRHPLLRLNLMTVNP